MIGAGTIGLLCAAVAAQRGASPIVVVAKHPHQAELAERMGADLMIQLGKADPVKAMREACDGGPDAVIDCVAAGTSFSSALAAARRQGRVVVVGEATRPLLAALGPVIHRELEVTGSFCYGTTDGKPDFAWAIELIQDGKVDVERLVTHTLPLHRMEEAFGIAADKSSGAIKVIVRFAE
ncbi:unnamed protein product [marine sediment metagenome]|uniref:Alcohol dehydrogenase-like C-terminal domain-containing protein n=1 Tax=marine sediment metagenome TaxID=412755 RepID=X0XWC2_9ZZZZ